MYELVPNCHMFKTSKLSKHSTTVQTFSTFKKLQKFKIFKTSIIQKVRNIKSSKNFKTSKLQKLSKTVYQKKKSELYKHLLGWKHALFKVLKFSKFAPKFGKYKTSTPPNFKPPRRRQTCSSNHPLLPSGRDQLQKSLQLRLLLATSHPLRGYSS